MLYTHCAQAGVIAEQTFEMSADNFYDRLNKGVCTLMRFVAIAQVLVGALTIAESALLH